MPLSQESQPSIYRKNNPLLTNYVVNSGFTKMAKSFSEQLRDRLAEKEMKPAELARRSGITKQGIGRILNNTPHTTTGALPQPERETVEKIARALDWNTNDALLAAGYAPKEPVEAQGFFSGYYDLSPDRQELARRQIKGILDSLAEQDHDTNYIDE